MLMGLPRTSGGKPMAKTDTVAAFQKSAPKDALVTSAGFAWEILRRRPDYRIAAISAETAASSITEAISVITVDTNVGTSWGLQFRRAP
jgi:outer membrane protein TolC